MLGDFDVRMNGVMMVNGVKGDVKVMDDDEIVTGLRDEV